MKKVLVTLAALAAVAAGPVRAGEPTARLEVAPLVGAFVPVGDQKGVLESAVLTGVLGTYDFHRNVAFVASLAWSPTQSAGAAVDLFQWDIGMQAQAPLALSPGWTLKPFAGVGIGTRTYSYRELDFDQQSDFVFYSALGADLRYRKLALGFTARHQLTAFGPAGDSGARGDLALYGSVGLSF
jgi:hypothetical protein